MICLVDVILLLGWLSGWSTALKGDEKSRLLFGYLCEEGNDLPISNFRFVCFL